MESRTRPLQAPPTVTKAGSRRRELTHSGLTWIDVTQPTASEAAHLRERLRLDPLALEDVLSTLQRPKLDLYPHDDYLFVILHVPVLDRDSRIVSSEVRVFAGKTFFVTLHDGDLRPLRRMFNAVLADEPARAQLMSRGTGYLLYRIIDAMFKQAFPILYRLDDDLGRLDTQISTAHPPGSAKSLGNLRREITSLRSIVLPNGTVVDTLQQQELPFLQIDAGRYFGDCADLIHKLIDLLDEQRDVVSGLGSTLDSLVHEQNSQRLQLIATIALLALPFVVLASVAALFGVAPVPGQLIPFAVALVATVAVTAGAVWYARSRRLL